MSDDARPELSWPTTSGPANPAPGWYPDGRGHIRWWDGLRWTEHVAGAQPHAGAAGWVAPTEPSAPRRHAGLKITGLVGGVVLALVAAVTIIGNISDTVAQTVQGGQSAGTAGYSTFEGPHGYPMRVGAPWGHPCVPVVFNVEDSVPDKVYVELVRVVAEARAAGLNVTVETRQHTWRRDEVYPPGVQDSDVAFVPVFADTDGGHLRSDGQPARDNVGWNATLEADGHHEHLTHLSETLHLATLGDDPLEYRRSLRKFVGWSHGISDSTHPDSALPLRDPERPDAFSAKDIEAMKTMSGCSGA
jgi:hypothetical protein